ncbi:MAG: tRNA 2-thiouridine(34) synthase MnmA [Actinobacteria bacterium]|nr:MAG: tRNA 2-thiouridine(34) synthase MnmA [Actinomycetota bacterium]
MARVWAAMSGGVDSSVAAALLVEQGHEVTGVTMRLLPDESACCGRDAARAARQVCDRLGIEHLTLDFRDAFEAGVVDPYCEDYAHGRTPNPCIDCNDRVKFAELLRRAALQDVDLLATGHYARVLADGSGGAWVGRGADVTRDQSYFLYRLRPEQLRRITFPVGGMLKDEVRAYAHKAGLPCADAPESREACFVPDGDVAAFVAARASAGGAGAVPGPIEDAAGRVLGAHGGIAGFTVGQRKGLGLGGGEPRYVVRIEAERNAIVVGAEADLDVTEVVASDAVWNGAPPGGASALTARVRYRGAETPCTAAYDAADGRLTVTFAAPVRAVAPGQAVVCYAGETVVGGGTVASAR